MKSVLAIAALAALASAETPSCSFTPSAAVVESKIVLQRGGGAPVSIDLLDDGVLRFTDATCVEATLCDTCRVDTLASTVTQMQTQIELLGDRLENLELAAAPNTGTPVCVTSMAAVAGSVACSGNGGVPGGMCPSFAKLTPSHTLAEAQAACLSCADCGGVYHKLNDNNVGSWKYCSKAKGKTDRRGTWVGGWPVSAVREASFKLDTCDSEDYCFDTSDPGRYDGSKAAEDPAMCKPSTTAACPTTMSTTRSHIGCSGNGAIDSGTCPPFSALPYDASIVEAKAACLACSDCHGVWRQYTSNTWKYCSKEKGKTSRRGAWASLSAKEGSFKRDLCDAADLCFDGARYDGSKELADANLCSPSTTN